MAATKSKTSKKKTTKPTKKQQPRPYYELRGVLIISAAMTSLALLIIIGIVHADVLF